MPVWKEPHSKLTMSQVVLGPVETYVEIHPEGLDVDLAVRRESDAVNAE